MKRFIIVLVCLTVVVAASGVLEAAQKYAGNVKCAMCHKNMNAKLWKNWAATKHAKSYTHMIAKYPKAAKKGKCLGCHTTGFGKGGFDPAKKNAADFCGIMCEGCHGPMGGHASNPMDKKLQNTKIRCAKCHYGPPQKGLHKHKIQLHGKK